MLRLPGPAIPLAPAERYALHLLVDLARLPPVDDPAADVVRLDVADDPAAFASPADGLRAGWHIAPRDGRVSIPRAALRLLADIVTARAERESPARDRHGRVPSAANALVTFGLEREPLVARAAVRLRDAVIAAANSRPVYLTAPWPRGGRWAAAVTHDLDVVDYWPVFTTLRLAELARKGRIGLALRVLAAAGSAVGRDPVLRGVITVLREELARGIASTWFILCGTPTLRTMAAGDLTYVPESRRAARIVREAAAGDHAVGLHGSFATTDVEGAFAAQRQRLEALVGRRVAGVRQHFLRFRPGATHRAMAAAGFVHDSSYGFPDRNGFRLGVADIVPLWDGAAGRAIGLDEAPVAWMDRALSKYGGVEAPAAWVDDALALAAVCREVEGLWVGVWHPNLVAALGFPGAGAAFRFLLDGLAAHRPCFATLDELAQWRMARRAARVRALAPDGRVELTTAGGTAVPLETPHAAPVRTVSVAVR